MIKAIIFDIGGVLIENVDRSINQALKNIDFIKFVNNYIKDIESGKIDLNALEKLFNKKFNKKINLTKIFIKKIKEAKLNRRVKNIILKLKKNYKLIYISNTIKEHYEVLKKRRIYDDFLYGIISYKIKLIKPSYRIYKCAIKKLKSKPNEVIFIDDIKNNLQNAKKLGINVIHYKNNKQLIKDLKKFNIKI